MKKVLIIDDDRFLLQLLADRLGLLPLAPNRNRHHYCRSKESFSADNTRFNGYRSLTGQRRMSLTSSIGSEQKILPRKLSSSLPTLPGRIGKEQWTEKFNRFCANRLK